MLNFQQQHASTHKEDGRKLLTASSIKGRDLKPYAPRIMKNVEGSPGTPSVPLLAILLPTHTNLCKSTRFHGHETTLRGHTAGERRSQGHRLVSLRWKNPALAEERLRPWALKFTRNSVKVEHSVSLRKQVSKTCNNLCDTLLQSA